MRNSLYYSLFFPILVSIVSGLNTDETVREKRVKSSLLSDFDEPAAGNRVKQSVIVGKDYGFPVVMPPYGKDGQPNPTTESCLLYLESVSVVVFTKKADPSSAVAEVIGTEANGNQFTVGDNSVVCSTTDPSTFKFVVQVKIKKPAEAKKMPGDSNVLFTVKDVLNIGLEFKVDSTRNWRLQNASANEIHVTASNDRGFLAESIDITDGSPGMVTYADLGGFGNYSFACSSTPAIVWKVKNSKEDVAVGISFNNIQIQPFGTVISDDKKTLRFGRDVNDCVGLFSIGSWMGIIVALLLLGVFFFGFLMLNSVQTMDRFDDPKQKQLIINAKE